MIHIYVFFFFEVGQMFSFTKLHYNSAFANTTLIKLQLLVLHEGFNIQQ